MPDNHTTALVKASQSPALARVSNQLTLTNKLLAKPEEPFLIPYRKGKKWGIYDRKKKTVIYCIFSSLEKYRDGFWIASIGPRIKYIINDLGRKLFGCFEDIIHINEKYRYVRLKKRFYLINNNYEIVFRSFDRPIPISISGIFSVNRDSSGSFIQLKEDEKFHIYSWGSFYEVGPFSEGLAYFIPKTGNEDYRIGFLDETGCVIINPMYDSPYDSENHEPEDSYIFVDGFCSVYFSNKWGIINTENKIIVPFLYEHIIRNDKNIIFALKGESLEIVEYYDYFGNKLSLPLIPVLDPNHDDFIAGYVWENDKAKWGFMNRNLQIVIEPVYDCACNFKTGLAEVQKDGLWGYINKKNEVVIDFQFTKASAFKGSLAAVRNSKNWGFIDAYGQIIIDFKYEAVYQDFENGLARVRKKSEGIGYIDEQGVEYWEN